MTTCLEIKKLSFSYGVNSVLTDFSLRVEAGEMAALLGPSGCGKSTVLKVIAGMLRPDKGKILFGEQDYTHIAAEKREAVMMFQKPLLFPYLNVADNVAFGLKMRKMQKALINEKVNEALHLVQLRGLERRMPNQLSGGQEQRVALARALVTQPRVLLLDEPLSALDANLRSEMRYFLRELQQSLGITTIFVTHDQAEAVALADRIAFMNAGQAEQYAEPSEFFTNPKTPDAARFFGWKIYAAKTEGNFIQTDIGRLGLSEVAAGEFGTDRSHLGFHPDSIQFGDSNLPSFAVDAEVLKITNIGMRLNCLLKLPDGSIIQAELKGEPSTSAGKRVKIFVPVESLRFFPGQNRER